MTTTPNMNLELPVVQTTVGPTYATQNNTALTSIDSHDHTSGSGVQIPSAGLNINADLSIGGYSLNTIKYTSFSTQTSITDSQSLAVIGGELYYRDAISNTVQLTNSGSVAGAAGSISGLVSPAAAVFSTDTFSWFDDQAGNEFAKMRHSDIQLAEFGNATANFITIQSGASIPSNYTITLPVAGPAASQVLRQNIGDTNTDFVDLQGTGNQIDVTHNAGDTTWSLSSTIVTPGSVDVGTTLDVTGATTLDTTLLVTGVATFTSAPVFSSTTASQVLEVDGSKNLISTASTGTGSIVKGTSPTITTATISDPSISGATFTDAPVFNSVTPSQILAVDGTRELISYAVTGTLGSLVASNNPNLSGATLGGTTVFTSGFSSTLTSHTLNFNTGVNAGTINGTPNLDSVGNGKVVATDSNGRMSAAATTGTGPTVVYDTSPTITTPNFDGIPTGTITSGNYTPTITFNAGTVGFSGERFNYVRVGNIVHVHGRFDYNLTGTGVVTEVSLTVPVGQVATDTVGGTVTKDNNGSSDTSGQVDYKSLTTVILIKGDGTDNWGMGVTQDGSFGVSFSYEVN